MTVVLLSGSPSLRSRSNALLAAVGERLVAAGHAVDRIQLGDVPPDDLVFARHASDAAVAVAQRIARASAVVVATPVYKASLGGGLKALLDLLPSESLAGKVALPIATGGSAGHQLALDFGLKPVLSALGARHILAGIYACDAQVELSVAGDARLSDDIATRVDRASALLIELLGPVPLVADVVPIRRYADARCSA